jgi:anti-sigma factor RsiW
MKHGMTQQEWASYLDGLTTTGQKARMEAHLSACAECRDFVERLRAVEAAIRAAAVRGRAGVALSPEQIAAARERTLARIDEGCVSIRIGALHLLLAPMCGVKTSTRAIRAAALHVSAASPRSLTEKLWPGFLNQLHGIVASLCGEPAARLVWQRGMNFERSPT